jgi:DNA repair exonuclease SbcCD ATPase subunit
MSMLICCFLHVQACCSFIYFGCDYLFIYIGQTKLKQLSEKMRDVVKKYADTKTLADTLQQEHTSLTQTLTQLRTEQTQAATKHESECVALKLKLENAENAIHDAKIKRSKDEEPISALTRDIARHKQRADESEMSGHYLEEECAQLRTQVRTLAAEKEAVTESLAQAQGQVHTLTQQLSAHTHESKQQADTQSAALRQQLTDAHTQIQSLQAQLEAEQANNKLFEDYKKRAQLALKTANQSTNTASTELMKVQALLDEATHQLADSEARCQALEQSYEAKIQSLTQALEQVQADHLSAHTQTSELTAVYKQMEFTNKTLASEVNTLRAQLAAFTESNNNNPNNNNLPSIKLPPQSESHTHTQTGSNFPNTHHNTSKMSLMTRNSDSMNTLNSSDADTEDSWVDVETNNNNKSRRLQQAHAASFSSSAAASAGGKHGKVVPMLNVSTNAEADLIREVGVKGYSALLQAHNNSSSHTHSHGSHINNTSTGGANKQHASAATAGGAPSSSASSPSPTSSSSDSEVYVEDPMKQQTGSDPSSTEASPSADKLMLVNQVMITICK